MPKKKQDLKVLKKPADVIPIVIGGRAEIIEFLKDQIKFVEENERLAGKAMLIVGYDDGDGYDDYLYASHSFSLRDFLYSSELIKFNLLTENYRDE